jgi:hypothetical protein
MRPPEYPQKGRSVEQTVHEIIDYLRATTVTSFVGGFMKQSRKGTTLSVNIPPRPKIQPPTMSPFYPTLEGNANDGYLLTMLQGYVILRKNRGEDAVDHIIPSGLPDKLPVEIGDKFTLQINENEYGEFESAEIVQTASDWPVSIAPKLGEGDEEEEEEESEPAVRHIRLCEIIQETDFPEVRIWSTGHVDHFAPSIIKNIDTSGARVLKEYEEGEWRLRTITAGEGVEVTEEEDSIEIKIDGDFADKEIINADTTGAGVLKGLEEDKWVLRRIVGGEGVTVEENENDITIEVEGGGGGEVRYHPWKVTKGDIVDGVQMWNIAQGFVIGQGTSINVAPSSVGSGDLVGGNGLISLRIERDSSSRDLTNAEVFIDNDVPESDDIYQFVVLAEVGGDPEIIQWRYHNVICYELMIVKNGEFNLATLDMSCFNTYEPPV